MNQPSEEQQNIINHIKNGTNVAVQAVAGSGKSTTVLSMAQQCDDKQILQLTYNASLRHEICEKVSALELKNIQIHTFHSLAVKYFSSDAHTDTGMRRVLLYNMKPRHKIVPIDILVIDENQDITELYFRFVIHYLLHMGNSIQVVCMGDKRQCIYEFKGADSRFLTMAPEIWSQSIRIKPTGFVHCTLKTSYRITNQMGKFINNAMIGEELMDTCRSGDSVVYIRNNRTNIENLLIFNINHLLRNGARPQDIFILAASVKSSMIRKLENKLVEENIPCFVPGYETEKLDDRVISGKIVFSTFHSVKGRQRKYVIVMGFDNSYFTMYGRDFLSNECPNTLYVGCSRATEKLFVVESDQFAGDRPLDFLKMRHRDMIQCDYVDFKGMPRSSFDNMDMCDKLKALVSKKYETPTKMIQFIPEYVLDEITPIIENIFICPSQNLDDYGDIDIPTVIATKNGFEDVSNINGLAIPSFFCEKKCKLNMLKEVIQSALVELKDNEHAYLKSFLTNIPENCDTIQDYLMLANFYVAIQERVYFKLKQINLEDYNWLPNEIIDTCIDRLDRLIHIKGVSHEIPEFEKQICHNSLEDVHVTKIDPILAPHFPGVLFRFSAIVDVMDGENIYELKCTSTINIEHKIQLIIYAWLWIAMEMPMKTFKLFNIKTGELFILNAEFSQLTQIVVALLKGKYDRNQEKKGDEFIKDCINHMNLASVNYLMDTCIESMDSKPKLYSCEPDNSEDSCN